MYYFVYSLLIFIVLLQNVEGLKEYFIIDPRWTGFNSSVGQIWPAGHQLIITVVHSVSVT